MKSKLFLRIKTKAQNKISSRGGMTMIEVLVACALLVIVSAMMVTGTKMGMKVYNDVASMSEGQVLCSTLSSMIKDELRYTGSMTIDSSGELISFFSNNYGSSEEAGFEINEDGQVYIGEDPILSKWAYVHGIKADNIIVNYKDDKFKVTLTIADAHGNIAAKSRFEVKPLNSIDITVE